MAHRTPIIELIGIDFNYDSERSILNNASFKFYEGESVGIIAPNGSGKTTLFHLIMGLLKPQKGTISIFGKGRRKEKDFIPIRKEIGLLFQDSDDQLFHPTVMDDVLFGPLNQGKSLKDALAISKKTLDFLGLSGFENRITFKLSGGEKRLVALASILSMMPKVILLDEPTLGLDEATSFRLPEILKSLAIPSIIISHDFDFLSKTTNQIVTLSKGKIIHDEKLECHHHPHAHPYGKHPHRHQ